MRTLFVVASPLVLAASVTAQQPEQLKALRWRSVGPANNAGRVSVVVGVPGNRDVYYVAGANGGIIKTTNGGITFKPIFDKQNVAVDRRDRDRAERSERHLRRHRRGEPAQQRVDRRRRCTSQSTPASTGRTSASTQSDKIARIVDRREESRPRLRVRPRARVGAERGARRLQDDRRRQDVEEGALRRLRRPPAPTSRPIRATRTSSTPACTRIAAGRGTSSRAAATRRCTSR